MHLILLILLTFGLEAAPCTREARAILDVGSGSLKVFAAEVELCKATPPTLIRVIDNETSFDLPLEKQKNIRGEIPNEAIQNLKKGIATVTNAVLARASQLGHKTIKIAAVGTHAYRSARNQAQVRAVIERETGIVITPISQTVEAELGVEGAMASPPPSCPPELPVLVWDIGGGSQQFTLNGKPRKFVGLNWGAEKFKLRLRDEPRTTDPKCTTGDPTSPNPIGPDLIPRASQLAGAWAKPAVDSLAIDSGAKLCVVGIGGVHKKAVQDQLNKRWDKIKACVCEMESTTPCAQPPDRYSQKSVQCLAQYLAAKSDCAPELQGPYATTAVSNLVLVLGLMQALNVAEVHTLNINMGHALVFNPRHLKFKALKTTRAL